MQPIRHLFWDFDGTLYDSYPQITHAFVQTLDALGQRGLFSETELLAALKVSVYYAACQCAQRAGLEPSNVMDVFHRYHAQEAAFPPYEGLESCLRTLHAAGIRHYLYTHRDWRAVAQLNVLCELALPLVKVGGQFLAMKSVDTEEEIAAAKGAIRTLGGKIVKVEDYTIPTSGVTHRAVVIEKVSPTPPRYPRAFAKIKKQPL